MIENYRTGKDMYSTMASIVHRVPYEECLEFYPQGTKITVNGKEVICGHKTHTNQKGKELRSGVKNIVLGLLYGRGPASIAEQTHTTIKEAQELINKFYAAFPTVKKWMDKTVSDAKINGFVETLWGRKRYIPDIKLEEYEFINEGIITEDFNPLNFGQNNIQNTISSSTKSMYINMLNKAYGFKARNEIIEKAKQQGIKIVNNGGFLAEAERKCVNSRIQGSAADLTKIAMINLYNNKELQDMGFKMLIQVHDEVIGEVPVKNAKRCGELLSQIMIDSAKDRCQVPMKVDATYFYQWYGEDIDIDKEI